MSVWCAADDTEGSASSEDEPLPGAAAALSALSDLTVPLSVLGKQLVDQPFCVQYCNYTCRICDVVDLPTCNLFGVVQCTCFVQFILYIKISCDATADDSDYSVSGSDDDEEEAPQQAVAPPAPTKKNHDSLSTLHYTIV